MWNFLDNISEIFEGEVIMVLFLVGFVRVIKSMEVSVDGILVGFGIKFVNCGCFGVLINCVIFFVKY